MLRNTCPATQNSRPVDPACRRTRETSTLPDVAAGPAERMNWRLHRHSKPSQEDTALDTDRMTPRNHCIPAQDVDDGPALVPGSSPATPLPLHFHETASDQDSEETLRQLSRTNPTPTLSSIDSTAAAAVRMSKFSRSQMESATRTRCMRKCMASQAAKSPESTDRPGARPSTAATPRLSATKPTTDRSSISRGTVASDLARKAPSQSERATTKSMIRTTSASPSKPISASPSKTTSTSPSKTTSSPSKTNTASPSRTSRTSLTNQARGREAKGSTSSERLSKETTHSNGSGVLGRQSARTEKLDNLRSSASSTTSPAGSRPCLLPAVTLSPASTPPSDETAESLECWPGQSSKGLYTDIVSPKPIRSANLEQSHSPLRLNNTGARRQHSPPLSPPLSPISPVSTVIPSAVATQMASKDNKEIQLETSTIDSNEDSLHPPNARRDSLQTAQYGSPFPSVQDFVHPDGACHKGCRTPVPITTPSKAIEHSQADVSEQCIQSQVRDRSPGPIMSVIGANPPRTVEMHANRPPGDSQMTIPKGSTPNYTQPFVDSIQSQISLDSNSGPNNAGVSTNANLVYTGACKVPSSTIAMAGHGVQQMSVETVDEDHFREPKGATVNDPLRGLDQPSSTPPSISSPAKSGISFLDKQAFLKQQLKLRDDARQRKELQAVTATTNDNLVASQPSEGVNTALDQTMRRAAIAALQELGFFRQEGSKFCNQTAIQSNTTTMTITSSPPPAIPPIQRLLAASSSTLFSNRQPCPQVITIPPSGTDSNNSTKSLPAEFPECLFQRPPSSPSKSPVQPSPVVRSPLRPRRALTVEAPYAYFGQRPLSPNTSEQCPFPDNAFRQEPGLVLQQEKRPDERPRHGERPRHASTLSVSSIASSLTLTSNSRPQSYLKDMLQENESPEPELLLETQLYGGNNMSRSPETTGRGCDKDISLLTTRLANLQVMDQFCPVDEGFSVQKLSKDETRENQSGCPAWMGAGWALQIQQLVHHLADEAYSELRSEGGPPLHDQLLRDWLRRLGRVSAAVWEAHPGLRREVDKIRWQQGDPPQRHATCT